MIHPSDWQCLRLGGWKNWTLIIGDHRWFHRWFTGDLPWKNPCRLAFRRDHSCSPPESANKESNLLESQIAPALWAFSLEVLFQDLWPRGLNPLSAFFSLFFLDFWGMNLRILAVCVVQIDFARLEVSQVMRHPQWSLKSWILHAINHPAISGYPMTMEPPTSCAMNFRPKAVSEIFYGARGRDPSTSETNGHDMVGC